MKLPPLVAGSSSWFGEALYNLRCALDYAVRDLAIADSGRDPGRDSQFPITWKKRDFVNPKGPIQRKMLGLLTPGHRDLIERMQPYKGWDGNKPFRPLADLNRLSNHDKHRLLHVALIGTKVADVYVDHAPRDCRIVDMTIRSFIQRPLEMGTDVIWINLADIGPEPHVDVNPHLVPYVGFRDGTDCLETLNDIASTVSQVLGALDPILEAPGAQRRLARVAGRPHRLAHRHVQVIGMPVRTSAGGTATRLWQGLR